MDPFRTELIKQRLQIEERMIKQQAIREQIKPWLKPFSAPGLYFPILEKGEIDLLSIRKELARQKEFLFPVVIDKERSLMVFKEGRALKKGAYGIVEPAFGEEKVPDVLLVPLLAFEKNGTHRIGYGKGFYDGYLKAHPEIFSIGVAFDEQEREFEIHPWDEPLDLIITPTRVIERSHSQNGQNSRIEGQNKEEENFKEPDSLKTFRPVEQKVRDLVNKKR